LTRTKFRSCALALPCSRIFFDARRCSLPLDGLRRSLPPRSARRNASMRLMTFAGARSFVLRSSDQTASQQPLIRKSRYIHEESVASRVQLRNPTTVHDRNDAVLHRACPLYGRQGTGSYLNLDLNLDETYSFLDHYDQKVLRHSLLMPMLRLREQREQPRQLTTSSERPDLDRHFLDQFLFS
jgi:hypothetical protein